MRHPKFYLCMCAFGVASKNRCNFCIENITDRKPDSPVGWHLHTSPKIGILKIGGWFFFRLHFSLQSAGVFNCCFSEPSPAARLHLFLLSSASIILHVLATGYDTTVRCWAFCNGSGCHFGVVFSEEKRWARVN